MSSRRVTGQKRTRGGRGTRTKASSRRKKVTGSGTSTSARSARSARGGVRRRGRGTTTKRRVTRRKKRITEKRFDKHSFSNPFSSRKKRYKTTFGQFYESGDIPCRISHGGSMTSITLKWDDDISTIPYNPYLIHFADGLRETEHPYVNLASEGFKEMLKAEGAREKVVPIMSKIIPLIRKAFQVGGTGGFSRALDAVCALSECVGEALNEHLNSFLIQINKKSFDRKFSQRITEVLNTIEENSGKSVTKLIKTKVPTYCSIFM